jgi:paraquat-inducible protein A
MRRYGRNPRPIADLDRLLLKSTLGGLPVSPYADRAWLIPLIACHDCGLLHELPELPHGTKAICTRCGGLLRSQSVDGLTRAFALNLAALLLFGVANSFPLMTMKLAGQSQTSTLLEGVLALYRGGVWPLAGLVLFVAIIFPFVRILGSLWVLGLLKLGWPSRTLVPVFRAVEILRPWAMTEVYLLGLIVAWVKLRDLATLHLDVALFAFIVFIVVMIWAGSALHSHEVWDRIAPQARGQRGEIASSRSYLACHGCGQLVRKAHLPFESHAHGLACPRCGSALHERKPEALARAWALLIAAAILYIPANLYPVMKLTSLGQTEPDTIISGVKAMIAVGMWPIALLVFFASITVPVLKIIGLAYLLVSVQRQSSFRRRDRTVLYRIIESVGRWSMVDIFMISILVALVNLGSIATFEPGIGAVAFASVVVLTMLAAMVFDPRLIWDAGEHRNDDIADKIARAA